MGPGNCVASFNAMSEKKGSVEGHTLKMVSTNGELTRTLKGSLCADAFIGVVLD